jgi:predicted Zn-dependent protease
MQARRAGIDHHNVVAAVTHGATSAKDLSDSDAAAVIQAIADLAAGRVRLEQDDEGAWRLIGDETGEEPPPPPPSEKGDLLDRVEEIRTAQADRKRGGQQTLPTETPQEDT